MRRPLLFLLLLFLGTTVLVRAQSEERIWPVAVDDRPPTMIDDMWQPFELEEIDFSDLPVQMQANLGADECADASTQILSTTSPNFGDVIQTNFFTSNPTDPDLAQCMFGSPVNTRGFRSVWYRFYPLQSGIVNIKTTFDPSNFFDSYDTVVALYRSDAALGECDVLSLLACNDDRTGFQSEVELFVRQWQTYYIEVVDWNFAVNGEATLSLAVTFDPGDSFWEVQERASQHWQVPRSRHAVVHVQDGTGNDYLYVIAGQTTVENFPVRDGRVDRYWVQAGSWQEMTPMVDSGYSNTTAALVNGRIYIPAGYVGNNSAYDGRHYVHDIGTNVWFENASPVPWDQLHGEPYAWSVAVPQTVGQTSGYFLTGGVLPGDNFPEDEPVGNLLFFVPSQDGASGSWNINLADMAIARYAHVAGSVVRPTQFGDDEQVCVAGGITKEANTYRALAHAECYSNVSGSWTAISPLNFRRFNAGSAVGPDGKWYVFGGTTIVRIGDNDVAFPLSVTERYDPETGVWEVLDSRYDLREPDLSWPRGAFADNTLWIFGGETFNAQTQTWGVVPQVKTLFIPPENQMLPSQFTSRLEGDEPNDNIETARPIGFFMPQEHNFEFPTDFFDFFSFVITEPTAVSARVTNIPYGSNYDVYLWDINKFEVGSSINIGNRDENATSFVLTPGVYYIMVVRVTPEPSSARYRLELVPVP
jgi:hypothetical protein